MVAGSASDIALGVDGGGTRTRGVLLHSDGTVLARSEAAGSNLRSAADAAKALSKVLCSLVETAQLSRTDRLLGGVLGLAGAGSAGLARAREVATAAWAAASLPGTPKIVPDLVVNFAAGSAGPRGVVLVAGTGAIAGRIDLDRVIARADGYGWLVGDEGSGTWLGREAVRAVLAALDGRGPATALTESVPLALEAGAGDPQQIIASVYDRPPAALAKLSPAVDAAARAGDPVAADIVGRAARHLLVTLHALNPASAEPIVLAGGILTGPTLIADKVRAELAGRTVSIASDGALGAARLALRLAELTFSPDSPRLPGSWP